MSNKINIKNKHINIRKNILILSLLFTLFLSLTAISYAKSVSSNLKDSVFRLHVLANSNTEEDQLLKYKVRDNLITYMNNLCSNLDSKDAYVEIGNFEFPTKNYGDISLPAGYYDSLRVKIGKAEGQNWWCVMFPPLCFVDVTSGVVPEESKENLKENLSSEDYTIISDDNPVTKFKFKIVELFKNFNLKLANN